jgi:hypothetical protein
MLKKAAQVAKELGMHRTTVSKVLRTHKAQLESHITIGKKKAKLITPEGVKIICDILGVEPGSAKKRSNSRAAHDDTHKEKAEFYERQLMVAQSELRNEKEERQKLQEAFIEAQLRADSIIMSLSNRLEDIQKRLPAPKEKEEPVAQTKPVAQVRTLNPIKLAWSAWQGFVEWLEAPDPVRA